MEIFIDNPHKKLLLRLYKEYDFYYGLINAYEKKTIKPYLYMEKGSIDEALTLPFFWALYVSKHGYIINELDNAKLYEQYFKIISKYYKQEICNKISNFINNLDIKKTTKKKIIKELNDIYNSCDDIRLLKQTVINFFNHKTKKLLKYGINTTITNYIMEMFRTEKIVF